MTEKATVAESHRFEEDERAPFKPMHVDKHAESDNEPCYPYLSRDTLREIARSTSRTANLQTYTWDETFGDGWWDREDRFWDIRRTAAMSDTTDYSEAPSFHSSDCSDDDGDDTYHPGI